MFLKVQVLWGSVWDPPGHPGRGRLQPAPPPSVSSPWPGPGPDAVSLKGNYGNIIIMLLLEIWSKNYITVLTKNSVLTLKVRRDFYT